jgi:hypothetical protein
MTPIRSPGRYLWLMTAKDKLREVVDELSEQEAEATLHFIDERRGHETDPLIALLDEAPPDDEPTTPEEDAGAAEARDEYKRGVYFDSDEIKRELG